MAVHGASTDMTHTANVLFGWDATWVASIILIVSFALIVSEKINRSVIALMGAGVMILMGVINQHQAIQGVDFNTLALLTGMMVIVGIARESGMFEYVAIYSAKLVKANPRALLAVLSVITAVFSALLDNVTTVMLIVPVTLLLTDQLKLPSYPFLFSQIFSSNVGGMATLIGDPPNILIGSAVGLSFMDFVENVGLASLIIMIFCLIFFDLLWGRGLKASENAKKHLMNYVPKEALKNKNLYYQSLLVIALVIFGFIVGHPYGYEPGTIAMFGAAFFMVLRCARFTKDAEKQSEMVHHYFTGVEWVTIFFFVGLFIIVYGVESTGLLNMLSNELLELTKGDFTATGMAILWSSAVVSAIVDNIPFVATMIPLIESMGPTFGGSENLMPLWWSLSLGACLGGNGSLVGASANLTVAGFAERAGKRISFMKFMALGFPLMLFTVLIAMGYSYLMFFAGL